jgi:hypothetical protein
MTYDEIADAQEQSQHRAEEAEHRGEEAKRQAVEARQQGEAQARPAAALEAELARLRGGEGTVEA